jgi:predicted nucleic acid-binding protein
LIVHLDTSLLIDALCAPHRSLERLAVLAASSHRPAISAPVFYEWLRGPRREHELESQERVVPSRDVVAFDNTVALIAGHLYRAIPRARGREMDIAIAACAIEHNAALWTLNPQDFEDIPGLTLYRG